MEQKEIIEGNKLIAEFVGMKKLSTVFDSHGYEQYNYSVPDLLSMQVYGHTGATVFLEDQFSKSWVWLMPVVEKICRLNIGDGKEYVEYAYPRTFGMLDDEGKVMVRLNGFFIHHADTLIEATYSAVIEFIQHHNSLNSK